MSLKAVQPFRIVLIGCGRVSRYHLKGVSESPDFNVIGVCDTQPDALAWGAQAFDARPFELEKVRALDAHLAVICTPSGDHYRHARDMLKAGLHVLIEKPATLNSEDLERLIDLSLSKNLRLFVVQQQRFLSSIQTLKTHFSKLGDIFAVQMHLFWSRPQSYFDRDNWRGTRALDGGILFNQGAHSVDLLAWLFGVPTSIHTQTKTLRRDIEFEDTIVCNFEFKGGALGTITSTILCADRNFEAGLTIVGEKGIVRLGGMSFEKIEVWDVPQTQVQRFGDRATDYVYENGHRKTYIEVAKALRGEKHLAVEGEQALKTIGFIEKIYKASEV